MKQTTTHNIWVLALGLLLCALCSPVVRAQDVVPDAQDADEVVRVHTRLVTVTASAFTSGGRPAPVEPSKLRVLADETPQAVAFADHSGASSVLLLVDKSTSMSGEPRKRLPYAVETFIKVADSRNEYTLITFGDAVEVLGTFKGDEAGRAQLLAALEGRPYAGNTAFYDACLKARALAATAPARNKRALVVFTDAQDNASRARLEDLRAGLDSIGGLTFVVVMSSFFATDPHRFDSPLPEPTLFEAARQLRTAFDGEAFAVRSKRNIDDAASAIARQLSDAVQLAFYPSPDAGRSGIHTLRVESAVEGVKIRARSRYFIEEGVER